MKRIANSSFARPRSGLHNEESERREGEDWSIAGEYVHSLLQQTKSEDAA